MEQTARRRPDDCEYIRLHRRRVILYGTNAVISRRHFPQRRHRRRARAQRITLTQRCLTFTNTDMGPFINYVTLKGGREGIRSV